jgi:glutamate synthase (ferredoxin)
VVDKYFTWTATRVEGSDIKVIAEEAIQRHMRGFPDRDSQVHALDVGGDYQWRKEGEAHLFNPLTIHTLQKAVRTGSYDTFKQYSALVNTQVKQFYTLRGLLDFKARRRCRSRRSNPSSDHEALQNRRDELRLHLQRGA